MIEKLNFAKLHRRGGTLGSFAVSTHFGQASKSMIRINNSNVGERDQERGDLLSRKLFPTFAPNHPSLAPVPAVIARKQGSHR